MNAESVPHRVLDRRRIVRRVRRRFAICGCAGRRPTPAEGSWVRLGGMRRCGYWVKTEWLEDNGTRLKEKHRFEGFDLLYSDEMIEFK